MEEMKYPFALIDIVQFGEYHCDLFQHFDIELDCVFFCHCSLQCYCFCIICMPHHKLGANTSNHMIISSKFLYLFEEIEESDSIAIHSNVTTQFIK